MRRRKSVERRKHKMQGRNFVVEPEEAGLLGRGEKEGGAGKDTSGN